MKPGQSFAVRLTFAVSLAISFVPVPRFPSLPAASHLSILPRFFRSARADRRERFYRWKSRDRRVFASSFQPRIDPNLERLYRTAAGCEED